MKKTLLICSLLLVFIISSCSSDDSGGTRSSVTARIDGTDYIFNTVNTLVVPYPEEGYADVEVTASINNNPDKRISFVVERYALGLEASWFFAYFLNDTFHEKLPGFQVSVTENTDNSLKGTFAGEVQSDEEPFDVITIENGVFNIRY